MSRVRIGFVGTGTMGQVAHMQNYLRLRDEVEIVALAEPRQDLAHRVAARAGVGRTYKSADEMVASENLDALVAPQQFMYHLQVVAPLYSFGLPIFTEKPLAMTSEIGTEMVRRLDASDAPFHMVGYHKRSDPAVQSAKNLVDRLRTSAEWGALRYVRMTMAGADWTLGALDDALTSDEPVSALSPDDPSVGSYFEFVNFYIHQLNLIRHLVGDVFHVTHGDRDGRILVGETEKSAIPVALEMAPWGDPGWDESVVVGFDQGSIRVTLPPPWPRVAPAHWKLGETLVKAIKLLSRPCLQSTRCYSKRRIFVAAVRGTMDPPSDAHDALLDLVVADEYFAKKEA